MKRFSPLISLNSLLHGQLHRLVTAELAREGLDGLEPCHGDILTALFSESCLTIGELARRTRRTKSTVSVLVNRLQKMGYVGKHSSPDDARLVKVSLAEKGLALRAAFERVSGNCLSTLTADFSEEEVATFERLLKKACGNFHDNDGAPG